MGESPLPSQRRWHQRYAGFSSNRRDRKRISRRRHTAGKEAADVPTLPVAGPADRFLPAASRNLPPTRVLRLHPAAAALEAELRDMAMEDDQPRSCDGIFELLARRERRLEAVRVEQGF